MKNNLIFIILLLLMLQVAISADTKTEKINVLCFKEGNFSNIILNALEQSESNYITIFDNNKNNENKYNTVLDYTKNKNETKYVNSLKLISDGKIQMYEAEVIIYTKDNKSKNIFECKNNTLISYYGNEKIIKIPDNIEIIGQNAFINNETCEEIILPKNLKRIESGAFYNCTNLKKLDLPNDLEYIGSCCFFNCKSLEDINIPKKINKINIDTFSQSGIKTLKIPSNVKTIEPLAFVLCDQLTDVNIADTDLIGVKAFSSCKSLKNVILKCKVIDASAYHMCTSLAKVEFKGEVEKIENNAFSYCGIESLDLNCKFIDNYAFSHNEKLVNVNIKCDQIGIYNPYYKNTCMEIFAGCNSLEKITIDTKTIAGHSFCDLKALTEIKVINTEQIYAGAINNCYNLQKISGIDKNTIIADNSVTDCFKLQNFPPE